MITLEEIYQQGVAKWGHSPTSFTDKGVDHDYIEFYQNIFKSNRNEPRLLEIGISSGGSAWLWSKYFVNPDIHAVDIAAWFAETREFQNEIQNNPNVHLHWNFDSTRSTSYLRTPGQFDYIIDDGDHNPPAQIETFRQAWPLVKPGGYYFIEDCQDLHKAQYVQNHIKFWTGNSEPKLFGGRRYPNRQDDLIVWVQKAL